MYQKILMTTTDSIYGKSIKDYLGIVSGEAVLKGNSFKDLKALIVESGSGRSDRRESILRDTREAALNEMEANADLKGANAIIGINFDIESISTTEVLFMVVATGTAIITD